jgi:3-hydroxymyristoyl/3-hydroxydecanoyl-(acyl carrier protein) dehydratase
MRLVHRVSTLDPHGGRFGIGLIRAEADIHPDDWFLTCHFVDDRVMPGTLMYECCLHTMRIFLLRLGWIATQGEVVAEPVPGIASRLKCRGQVIGTTQCVTYEVVFKERGYCPEPYAIADALLYADGKPIVEITDMSLRLAGLTQEAVTSRWQRQAHFAAPAFTREQILAFATGKPSEAFGEAYRVFDDDRFIARLPGPPFSFLDRIVHVEAEPSRMVTGGIANAEYDVPPDAWYFGASRQSVMPFAVLLEVALQPCGWLAAYIGSAMTSTEDLCFRNLGGQAVLHTHVGRDAGTLATRVHLTNVATSAGMILQQFAFEVRNGSTPVYTGTTTFGFFTRAALAQQVGIRDARLHQPSPDESIRSRVFEFPRQAPWPEDRWRMLDQVNSLIADGGPKGLGFVQGSKIVNPQDWFFQAHFFQDPVWPGSLGLESFLQLLQVVARQRWGIGPLARLQEGSGIAHRWSYRGQVLPDNRQVTVQATITACEDGANGGRFVADGWLEVDGRVIYRMNDFALVVDCGEK